MSGTERVILCFGDSNTWGYDVKTGRRLSRAERWPGVVEIALGAGYRVIEGGLRGRTTGFVPLKLEEKEYLNGRRDFYGWLRTASPLDLVIIMLGTNDFQRDIRAPPVNSARCLECLLDTVRTSKEGPGGTIPKSLLVIPPPMGKLELMANMYGGGEGLLNEARLLYMKVAVNQECPFLDAGPVVGRADEGHLDPVQHLRLGKVVAAEVARLLTK